MNFENIINHMNDDHESSLIGLCVKFGDTKDVKSAKLVGVDFEGLDIVFNSDQKLRVNFPHKADESTIKDTIISLCKSASSGLDTEKLSKEISDFMLSFNSICLATIANNNQATCTYAPFVSTQWGNYIYISEVSDHYKNIKENPNNIEAMFLEDESKAASVILRKRLRYKIEAHEIERGELFDKIYDEFEKQTGGGKGIDVIRNMQDFHLIRFDFKKGSYVKGFGQAYAIGEDGSLTHMTMGGSGHKRK